MREILFRGKRLDNGEWAQGDLSQHKDGRKHIRCWYAGAYTAYEVDPGTVGQYTGLTDKNGMKIFEGDLLKSASGKAGRVTWYPEHVAFMIYSITPPEVFGMASLDTSAIEVIGNIHDTLPTGDNYVPL